MRNARLCATSDIRLMVDASYLVIDLNKVLGVDKVPGEPVMSAGVRQTMLSSNDHGVD